MKNAKTLLECLLVDLLFVGWLIGEGYGLLVETIIDKEVERYYL